MLERKEITKVSSKPLTQRVRERKRERKGEKGKEREKEEWMSWRKEEVRQIMAVGQNVGL